MTSPQMSNDTATDASGATATPMRFEVTLLGTVSKPRLHQLIRQRGRVTDRTFEITFLDSGVHAYVFTFG